MKGKLSPSFKHGQSHVNGGPPSTEYRSWAMARNRCNNPNYHSFARYGGRGVKFLFGSFEECFKELGPKPTPQHSLDRYPNKEGHYEKGNVRWATKKEQANNRTFKNHWTRGSKSAGSYTSRFVGVSWDPRKENFFAQSSLNKKNIFLGYFDTEEAAAKARDMFIIEHQKEFEVPRLLNFPQIKKAA